MEVPKFGSFKPKAKVVAVASIKREEEEQPPSKRSSPHRVEKSPHLTDCERHRHQHRRGHHRQDHHNRPRQHDDQNHAAGSGTLRQKHHTARDAEFGLKPEQHESREREISIAADELEESNLFIIDRRGDSKNLEYGSIHRYSVPTYHRTGYGNLIGYPLSSKIDREASSEKEVRLISSLPGKRAHQKISRLLSSKYGRNSETRLKFVSAAGQDVGGEGNDFIQLSSTRNCKRAPTSIEPDGGVDYRSIEGKAKASNNPADVDVEYASDSDNTEQNNLDLRARQESAILSKRAKANPSALEPWLALADHQSQLVRPGINASLLPASERRTLAELRLSILNEAGKTISRDKPGRERLLLAMLEEGTPLWDKTKLMLKWKDALAECPTSIFLWSRYMNFVQYDHSSFQYETCKEAYMQWLKVLKTAYESSDGGARDQISQTQVHALLRFTTFIRDAGYDELATAIWQALIEFHWFMATDLIGSSLEARLNSLEDYWDIEAPRVGEEGTRSWAGFHVDGPSKTSRRRPAQFSAPNILPCTPFRSFAHEEASLAGLFLLPASTEDDDAITDPFRCIVFEDLRAILECLGMELPKRALLSAFLHYAGLPPVPSEYYKGAAAWSVDPHLASGSDAIELHSRRESTFSLFESAFQDFHFGHSANDTFPRFVDRILFQFCKVEGDEECALREYFLAFKARVFPKEATSEAKRLLKGSPTSLRLYNAYALAEAHANRGEKATSVWDAALGMFPRLEPHEQDNAVLLWHSRLIVQIMQGDEAHALRALLSISSSVQPLAEENSNHIIQLRLRRNFESGFDRMLLSGKFYRAVLFAELLAWLTYLTQDVMSAISSYNHHIASLSRSNAPGAVEAISQGKARMMMVHLERQRPYKPSTFQDEVADALERFPSNSVLLELQFRLGTQDRLRTLMSEQKRSAERKVSVVEWSFKFHGEIERASDAVAGGGTINTVRATAAKALMTSGTDSAHSVALWKAWLNFEVQRGNMRMVKNVFLDGLRALPGVKEWAVLGMCTGCMEEAEMRRVWEGLVEKGLRLRVGVEEFL